MTTISFAMSTIKIWRLEGFPGSEESFLSYFSLMPIITSLLLRAFG